MQAEIEEIAKSITAASSPDLSGMPHGSEPSRLDNVIIRLDDIMGKYKRKLAVIAKEQREIEDALDTLDDPKLRVLMRYRYIKGMKWEEVAEKMHYELRWIYHLHGIALYLLK